MTFLPPLPVIRISEASDRPGVVLRESCGLAHEQQVIEVALEIEVPEQFLLEDVGTGRRWPGQRVAGRTDRGYLHVELPADAVLDLRLCVDGANAVDATGGLCVHSDLSVKTVELSNDFVALRCFLGSDDHPQGNEDDSLPGPVLAVRQAGGAWRGRTFFDCRSSVVRRSGRVTEAGSVRLGYHFVAELRNGGRYEAEITLDRESVFARVRETYSTDEGDQLVWDFEADDLPTELHVLDSTAGMSSRGLDYSLDRRQARLWCWTQQSQLFDLVDGFAVTFGSGADAIGLVALAPGSWRGRQLNHIEVWARRWNDDTPWTRRRTPVESRADAVAGPDFVPAHGSSVCRPHLTLEAWLGKGAREFGLVLAPAADLWSDGRRQKGSLTHFEVEATPGRYQAEQGLLRRLHVQRGVFSLQEQLETTWAWPEDESGAAGLVFEETLRRQIPFAEENPDAPENIAQMKTYLEARVLGFWTGSGSAYTNPVVSRRVAPYMEYYDWLAIRGLLSVEERGRLRAWFVFLATLFASEHYYPGEATMRPLGDPDGTEPTLKGMANQNFHTDVLNIPGMAAQVFGNHPEAKAWRSQAVAHWSRQLDYHVYPQSGVWEESHTYYLHVLLTMCALVKRWRDDGVVDFFADARFQQVTGAALPQVTPRDVIYNDRRHLLAWGDHDAKPQAPALGALADFAQGFYPHAPVLAGQLAWMVSEMGGGLHGISPVSPPWASCDVRGLGFVFRSRSPVGGEVLVALRAGAAWGHHHNDDGSLQVFAKGRAWVVDASHGHAPMEGRRKFSAAGHSRLVPDGLEPANYLWRFSRGWIVESSATGPLPYAVAWLPTQMAVSALHRWPQPLAQPFFARRAVVQLTPLLFVVIDEHDQRHEHEVGFHLAVEQVTAGGAVLRGEAPEGVIELTSVAAEPDEWRISPRDLPADGERSRATWPCHRRLKGNWHLTVIAVLAAGEASPVVTPTETGARVQGGAGQFELSRQSGPNTRWVVKDLGALDGGISFSMAFGYGQPVSL